MTANFIYTYHQGVQGWVCLPLLDRPSGATHLRTVRTKSTGRKGRFGLLPVSVCNMLPSNGPVPIEAFLTIIPRAAVPACRNGVCIAGTDTRASCG